MKKIMFNDALGLTQAVLDRRKTQTRRVATYEGIKCPNIGWALEGKDEGKGVLCKGEQVVAMSAYAKGEIVAVAQSYEDILKEVYGENADKITFNDLFYETHSRAGLKNKMFVKADIMRHHIKITNIRVERLQDISEEDCKCEGIYKWSEGWSYEEDSAPFSRTFRTPYETFRALIGKLGRKMWERNPFVFVYDFELVD